MSSDAPRENHPGLYRKITGNRDAPRFLLTWLHGWGQDHRAFLPAAGLFENVAENHLYDLPGFGASPLPPTGAGSADYANILLKERGQARAAKHILIGHSFGCRVAIQIAANHPETIDGLVLIAAAGIPRSRSIFWKIRSRVLRLLGKAARFADSRFKTSFAVAYSRRFGSADYRNAGPLQPTFVRVVNENLTQCCRAVRVPVLLIYGDEDTETPVEIGRKFEGCLPYAELKILSGYGHNDILNRGKYQCETLIRRFLAKEFGAVHD